MDLKQARLLGGWTQLEVERRFGVSRRTLQNWEEGLGSAKGMKEILMREFLRSSMNSGNFAIIAFSKPTINAELPAEYSDFIRFYSLEDAGLSLKVLCEKYVPERKGKEDLFYEIGIWECDKDWKPVRNCKRIVKEYGIIEESL